MENKTAEREKRIAVDFFYWWHNQPGTNTEEGFKAYKESERYKMLDVSITIEADIRDEQLSLQCAEMKEELEDSRIREGEANAEMRTQRARAIGLQEEYGEMKEENKRLKAELMERDAIWLPAKDAEIESSHIENKQLQEEVERLRSALKWYADLDNFTYPHVCEIAIKALSGKESKTE